MLSYAEVDAAMCAPGEFFEIETVDIHGRPTKTWKNAPRNIREVLAQGAGNGGGRDFLVLEEERVSHAEHFRLVARLATVLVRDLGVRKGDRVAIAMRNLPEWSVAFFAATTVGAIAVPLNGFWNGEELAFALGDCEPKVLIADGQRLERLGPHADELAGVTLVGTRLDDRAHRNDLPAGVLPYESLLASVEADALPAADPAPDDPATIFYTSGTTSRPKGVLGTHRNICVNLISLMYALVRSARRRGDELTRRGGPTVLLVPVPLFHATGCHSMLFTQANFGGTLVLMRKWDPERALDLIEAERVTQFSGVPTMVWDLLNSPTLDQRDLSSLMSLGGGGSASPPELVRRIRQRFPDLGASTGYGMTETSSITSSISGADYVEHPDSVGAPVPVCEVRIVEDGKDVPPGEPGEIWIKGPNVVLGYWRRPEETAATFTDGWLHSGDIGRIDEEGFLYIVDRAKDIVIRGGENISSLEVESALYEHPDVLEVAVFGRPHDTLGEEVAAVVRLRPGSQATVDSLRGHAAARLAPFKVPAQIWLTAEPLPRSGTGKILKREIRAAHV
ncbi:MAG: AMP-binding protein [Frankia sp.]|nr:AMP-binding protein [Frankia sp.]